MFSGMGMFGAFGFDPEEEAKKNEEMKREAELRKKFEENLDKPITITQRQFTEISAQVLTNGKFMSMAKESKVEVALVAERDKSNAYQRENEILIRKIDSSLTVEELLRHLSKGGGNSVVIGIK